MGVFCDYIIAYLLVSLIPQCEFGAPRQLDAIIHGVSTDVGSAFHSSSLLQSVFD